MQEKDKCWSWNIRWIELEQWEKVVSEWGA